jgi:hypothetical protein
MWAEGRDGSQVKPAAAGDGERLGFLGCSWKARGGRTGGRLFIDWSAGLQSYPRQGWTEVTLLEHRVRPTLGEHEKRFSFDPQQGRFMLERGE